MGVGEILGFDEAGEGPLLVLIHGFPLDRWMWVGQFEGLKDIRRVVAVDLPGRGRSLAISAKEATMDAYADHVATTIVALGTLQADVVGLSMGGYVAFALWRRHPHLVRSLILADTRAGPDSEEGKAARGLNADKVWAEGTVALVEGMLPKLLSPSARHEVVMQVLPMFEDTPALTAIADLIAMRDRPDSTPTLATITVPTLIVRGADDALMGPEEVALLARGISAAQTVTIPDAGHLSPLENPEAFNAAARAFLGDFLP